MLYDIKQRLSLETGLDLTSDVAKLLQLINDAAEEFWQAYELPGTLEELVLTAYSNQTIAFPAHVGEVRAVRHQNTRQKMNLHTLHPKYGYQPLNEEFFKFQKIGTQPIQQSLTDATTITATTSIVEDAVVNIIGSTDYAALAQEALTLNATSVTGTVPFTAIKSINTQSTRTADITLRDSAGTELAVLPNNQKYCAYLIYRISQYPSLSGELLDVLYKPSYKRLALDADVFAVPELENAVFYMANALWLASQDGKEARTKLYVEKATSVINAYVARHSEELFVQFAPNPLLGIQRDYATFFTNKFLGRYESFGR